MTATLPAASPAFFRTSRSPLWFAMISSLWMATVGNMVLWHNLFSLPEQAANAEGILFAVGFAVLIACLNMLVMIPLAWRPLIKPVSVLLLLTAGFGAYFMMQYNIVIDGDMINNVLQTDVRETRDLLNWRMLVVVGIVALLPTAFFWRIPVARAASVLGHLGRLAVAWVAALVIFAMTLLACYQPMASLMRNHHQIRYTINPLTTVYSLVEVTVVHRLIKPRPFQDIGQDATLGPAYADPAQKPPLMVLVLGETGRAGNFSLNGYDRDTNPLLAKDGVLSFHNVWSCGTSTATAVPCMYSHLGKVAYEARDKDYATLMDVLQHAGLAVLWIDNQPAGCKGVCDRVPHVMTSGLKDPALCPRGECMDQIMLRDLDRRIAELPAERRAKGIVIAMHQMGSHGPAYSERSDASTKKFLPECTTNVLQDCPHDQLVNAYDNSIVYTDKFLHDAIGWLRTQSAAHATSLLYVADHGESLGENNLYLHGLPYSIAPDVQKHVPMILWQSPEWQKRTGTSNACLSRQLDERYSEDNYFHTVLGALQVRTGVYRPDWDITHQCASAAH